MMSDKPSSRTRSLTPLLPLLFAGLALGSTGCAQLGALEAKLKQAQRGDVETSAADPSRSDDAAQVRPLGSILADLQGGDFARGEQALTDYLERHPQDAVARAVMRQLKADPETVLGRTSHRYVVQPGDSYSALAARHLGDAGLFLILARYNGSTDPSDLRVGEVLRLPGDATQTADSRTSGNEADMPGKGQPAVRRLSAAPVPSRQTAAALALPDEPLAAYRPANSAETLPPERLQREAADLQSKGRTEAALARYEAALELDPDLEPAARRAQALREQLVDDYHQRAILRYRNQDLAEAIALWDRVLAIDPQFEPAQSYRARARELQRRLEQL
ncbi:LysM peptidoglycan-binding domain-containing protein [Guyparkeria sp. 1SP6A2]|nr:LysM peptidoglycan-binding domain-containing protein [Guyparkeria sp. 1SP6A2]